MVPAQSTPERASIPQSSMLRPFLFSFLVAAVAVAEDWPQWRGPRLDGTSTGTGYPIRWSATEGIRWKTELPGRGHASPIVCKDRIFTVSAIEDIVSTVSFERVISVGGIYLVHPRSSLQCVVARCSDDDTHKN